MNNSAKKLPHLELKTISLIPPQEHYTSYVHKSEPEQPFWIKASFYNINVKKKNSIHCWNLNVCKDVNNYTFHISLSFHYEDTNYKEILFNYVGKDINPSYRSEYFYRNYEDAFNFDTNGRHDFIKMLNKLVDGNEFDEKGHAALKSVADFCATFDQLPK
ncbi:MAG: hypothetical protein WC747_04990 [Candidatus Babeliales bacterium]|jgi:hypothetical protein